MLIRTKHPFIKFWGRKIKKISDSHLRLHVWRLILARLTNYGQPNKHIFFKCYKFQPYFNNNSPKNIVIKYTVNRWQLKLNELYWLLAGVTTLLHYLDGQIESTDQSRGRRWTLTPDPTPNPTIGYFLANQR